MRMMIILKKNWMKDFPNKFFRRFWWWLQRYLKVEDKNLTYTTFTVNHAYIYHSYTFDTRSPYWCNINCLYLVYQHSVNCENPLKNFFIPRWLAREEIKYISDYTTLLVWAKEKEVTFRKAIPTDKITFDRWKPLLWVYKDVEALKLKDMSPTDLITYWIQLWEGTRVHNIKYEKLSQDCKGWLHYIIEKSIVAEVYERTVTANGCLSK